MTETGIGTVASLALVGLAGACWLYMLGGRSGKWRRRFVASAVLATTVNGCAGLLGIWSWGLLLVYPAVAAGFHLGYGADDLGAKIRRRAIFALGVVSAGLVCAVTIGGLAWAVLPLHIGVAAWSIYLGVRNPVHAAAEEVFVCAVLNLGLIAYPFAK